MPELPGSKLPGRARAREIARVPSTLRGSRFDLSWARVFRLFRLFIAKGKAERRGVFRPKGLFAFSLLLARLFRGGSTEVV